jgi:hypothetical protein
VWRIYSWSPTRFIAVSNKLVNSSISSEIAAMTALRIARFCPMPAPGELVSQFTTWLARNASPLIKEWMHPAVADIASFGAVILSLESVLKTFIAKYVSRAWRSRF